MMSVPGDVPRIFCKHAREKILCAECTPQGDMFEHNVGITNDFTPWIADELVQQEPLLLDIIQRKKRSKPQGGSLVS